MRTLHYVMSRYVAINIDHKFMYFVIHTVLISTVLSYFVIHTVLLNMVKMEIIK
jgi:hypothetical protein